MRTNSGPRGRPSKSRAPQLLLVIALGVLVLCAGCAARIHATEHQAAAGMRAALCADGDATVRRNFAACRHKAGLIEREGELCELAKSLERSLEIERPWYRGVTEYFGGLLGKPAGGGS